MESLQDDEAEDEAAVIEAKKRAQEEKKLRGQLRAAAKTNKRDSPIEMPPANRPLRPLRSDGSRKFDNLPHTRSLPAFAQSRSTSAPHPIAERDRKKQVNVGLFISSKYKFFMGLCRYILVGY